jgi:Rhs element Vgr protein
MPEVLISDHIQLVTFSILIDGKVISDTINVISIELNSEINKIPTAKIQIADGGVAEKDDFLVSNSADFIPGKEITIQAGYNSQNEDVFKGVIVKHSLKIKKGASFIYIEAKHKAVKLTIGRKNKIFIKKKDSDIITNICQSAGVNKDVEATDFEHPEAVQHYVSDWDFILNRAEINGLLVIPDLDKLCVKKPNFSSPPVYVVEYGVSMLGFNADIDARTQLKGASGFGWDAGNQELITAKGSQSEQINTGNLEGKKLADVIGLEEYVLQSAGQLPMSVLDKWSSAKLIKAELAKVRGTVQFTGGSKVHPGDIIELKGLSERFNGNAYVGGVNHKIAKGDWTTEVIIGLSEKWYTEETPQIEAPSASGINPPFKGLTTAIVTKLESDEEGNFRVKVKIPTLSPTEELWARLSTFYASKEFGVFFYPEIGDEVIVAFLNEDPQHPIILGSMYSKTKATPLPPKDDNNEKAIISRSLIKIHFEDEKKILTIETPAKNTIILDDDAKKITIQDCNNNLIEMSDSGIKIESPKDITLKAQNIKAEGQQNIELKATSDLKGEGMNVKIKASVQFGAEGAMAELKGSGQTTIKGGMVMIN